MARPGWVFDPFNGCCGYDDILTCPYCVIAPAQLRMTISSNPDWFCSDCSVWEGDWVLTNDSIAIEGGSPCTWSTPIDDSPYPCTLGCSGCSRWSLNLLGTIAELTADGGLAIYSIDPFNCTGTNVFTSVSLSADCHWPTSITVSPV